MKYIHMYGLAYKGKHLIDSISSEENVTIHLESYWRSCNSYPNDYIEKMWSELFIVLFLICLNVPRIFSFYCFMSATLVFVEY